MFCHCLALSVLSLSKVAYCTNHLKRPSRTDAYLKRQLLSSPSSETSGEAAKIDKEMKPTRRRGKPGNGSE